MPWANVVELAKERTLCAFFMLCDSLALIPQTPQSGTEHRLSGEVCCMLLGNTVLFNLVCICVSVLGREGLSFQLDHKTPKSRDTPSLLSPLRTGMSTWKASVQPGSCFCGWAAAQGPSKECEGCKPLINSGVKGLYGSSEAVVLALSFSGKICTGL